MTITPHILGAPGRDNAVYLLIDSGQALSRLLFDCGEAVLHGLGLGEIQAIDGLFFSHLHMDHVAGFDSFFRATYNRQTKPNRMYGPPHTAEIMQHRMQGFMWNLEAGAAGQWQVCDVLPEEMRTTSLLLGEAFARRHPGAVQPRLTATIVETPEYTVEAYQLNHQTPSLAYMVRERPRLQINSERLAAMGFMPGPWLQQLKQPQPDQTTWLEIQGVQHRLAELRAALLKETPGESLAYCTDFLLDAAAFDLLVPALRGCTTLICESQYRHSDSHLAQRNYHVTAIQAAELARAAEVEKLFLFHVSDRYRAPDLHTMLSEARAVFANSHFPPHWAID